MNAVGTDSQQLRVALRERWHRRIESQHLGGTDEGEVCGVEQQHEPLSLVVGETRLVRKGVRVLRGGHAEVRRGLTSQHRWFSSIKQSYGKQSLVDDRCWGSLCGRLEAAVIAHQPAF